MAETPLNIGKSAQRLTASDRQSRANGFARESRFDVLNALRHLIGNQSFHFHVRGRLLTVLNALRHLIGNQVDVDGTVFDAEIVLNALRHLIGNQTLTDVSSPACWRCSTPYGI